ncbi:SAM-dependent methyltransferase, partial [Aquitalea sp. S1-19]|nr:SAM-dependent methyltransferase [Aquitalea sp. S1-19]
ARSGDIGLAEAYRDGLVDSPDWVALMHLATVNEHALEQAIHGSWLGTLAYWLRHLTRANTRAGLSLADDYRFGADYAETLRRWHTQFEEQLQRIHVQGFDEAFVRLWRFYLAYCIAGFDTERTDVCQLEIHRS